MLRQFPLTPGKVKIELSVIDTGKVSSKFTHHNLLLPFTHIVGYKSELLEGNIPTRGSSYMIRHKLTFTTERPLPPILSREPSANWYGSRSSYSEQHRQVERCRWQGRRMEC